MFNAHKTKLRWYKPDEHSPVFLSWICSSELVASLSCQNDSFYCNTSHLNVNHLSTQLQTFCRLTRDVAMPKHPKGWGSAGLKMPIHVYFWRAILIGKVEQSDLVFGMCSGSLMGLCIDGWDLGELGNGDQMFYDFLNTASHTLSLIHISEPTRPY